MSRSNSTLMEKAESRFAERLKRTTDRTQATAEYVSEAKTRAAKTAKLRELRLARDEAERAAGTAEPVKVRAHRAPRSVKGKTLFSRILTRTSKR
jgi:hypothetical protein